MSTTRGHSRFEWTRKAAISPARPRSGPRAAESRVTSRATYYAYHNHYRYSSSYCYSYYSYYTYCTYCTYCTFCTLCTYYYDYHCHS